MNIPLFPIDTVLLPNEEMPLHIFENRYKNMITECLNSKKDFGMVLKNNNKIYNIGCTAKILDVEFKYDTGEYDIIIKGDKRFNLINMIKKENLWIAEINYLNNYIDSISLDIIDKVRDRYINILLNHKIVKDIDFEINKCISYDFVKKIILPSKLKQMFLELENEYDRMIFLDDLFDKVIKVKTNKDLDDFN